MLRLIVSVAVSLAVTWLIVSGTASFTAWQWIGAHESAPGRAVWLGLTVYLTGRAMRD